MQRLAFLPIALLAVWVPAAAADPSDDYLRWLQQQHRLTERQAREYAEDAENFQRRQVREDDRLDKAYREMEQRRAEYTARGTRRSYVLWQRAAERYQREQIEREKATARSTQRWQRDYPQGPNPPAQSTARALPPYYQPGQSARAAGQPMPYAPRAYRSMAPLPHGAPQQQPTQTPAGPLPEIPDPGLTPIPESGPASSSPLMPTMPEPPSTPAGPREI